MPCPPSYEELRLMELDRLGADIEKRIAPRVQDLTVIHEVLVAVAALSPIEQGDRELIESFAFVSDLRPELPLPRYRGPKAICREGYPGPTDMPCYEAEANYRSQLLARIDLAACVFGCALMRWLDAHGTPGDSGLATRIEDATARHRLHRITERDELITEFETGPWRRTNPKFADERLATLRAIDDATLLRDRTVLHR